MDDILVTFKNDEYIHYIKQDNIYKIYRRDNKGMMHTLGLRTPLVKCPFGLESYNSKYYINFEFTNYKKNNDMYNFKAIIQNIDEYYKTLPIIQNDDLSKLTYFSNIKERPIKACTNDKYDPLLRTTVKYHRKKCLTNIHSKAELRTIYDVQNNTQLYAQLELTNLWIYNTTYGLTWTITDIYLQ
jgi:hypothetical protein